MNNLLVYLITGAIGSVGYYIEQVFIQKNTKVVMQDLLKVFLFSFALSFVSLALMEIFGESVIEVSKNVVAGASNVISNPAIMTGQPPF
jgi:hypothetical protein